MNGKLIIITRKYKYSEEIKSGNMIEVYQVAKDLKEKMKNHYSDLAKEDFLMYQLFPSKMNKRGFDPDK